MKRIASTQATCCLLSCSSTPVRHLFSPTRSPLLGLEQIADIPTSTDRIPKGLHRGPGKRMTNRKEAEAYQFIKKWDLVMKESWDPLEPFKGLPKPKKLFGNEAAEIIWPYALLMERVIKVHPFTKGIYVYYSQHQQTELGKHAAAVAKHFSRRSLIPITFHNNQCYVETEMLLEYSETPWVVIHCLDGRSLMIPVEASLAESVAEAEDTLLRTIVKKTEELGASVSDPKSLTRALHERPLQNQYLRINYQWFGDTMEERMSHLVRWDFEPEEVAPKTPRRNKDVLDWLNFDGDMPTHNSVKINVVRESKRLQKPNGAGGKRSFLNSQGRADAKYSRFGGGRATGSQ